MYLNESDTTIDVIADEGENSKGPSLTIDTIGDDPFVDVGLISNSNAQLESYYAITSEGYLYT